MLYLFLITHLARSPRRRSVVAEKQAEAGITITLDFYERCTNVVLFYLTEHFA